MKNNNISKVISFINQKGGVSKSTLSINLAYGLHLRGYSVLLFDADNQNTAIGWASVREQEQYDLDYPVIGSSNTNLAKEVDKLKKNYDFVIVDSAGRNSQLSRLAVMCSDFIIVPNNPSPFDMWATQETLNTIEEISSFKKFKAYFLMTRMDVRKSGLIQECMELLTTNYVLPSFNAYLPDSSAFSRSALTGRTVFDYRDKYKRKAVKEINAMNIIIDELLEKMEITNGNHAD